MNKKITASIVLLFAGALGFWNTFEPRVNAAGAVPEAVVSKASHQTIYHVEHALEISALPKGAHELRIWFWFPDDNANQKVLDQSVRSADDYQIVRNSAYGNKCLYVQKTNPGESFKLATDFVIRRSEAIIDLDPAAAGELTDSHRKQFAADLACDVPNMEITDGIKELSTKICGTETNEVKKAKLIFDWVVNNNKHYSRPGAPKSSGKGSASYCLAEKGGSCTDIHSLFICLARAQGIPTRLQFGSMLKPANAGKLMDPGYRCWVEYYVPNYGWIAADLAAANTNPEKHDFYFSGLDDRRIHFMEGRNLDLTPRQNGPKLNLMISAYVEIDGKPFTDFKRTLKFDEINWPARTISKN